MFFKINFGWKLPCIRLFCVVKCYILPTTWKHVQLRNSCSWKKLTFIETDSDDTQDACSWNSEQQSLSVQMLCRKFPLFWPFRKGFYSLFTVHPLFKSLFLPVYVFYFWRIFRINSKILAGNVCNGCCLDNAGRKHNFRGIDWSLRRKYVTIGWWKPRGRQPNAASICFHSH